MTKTKEELDKMQEIIQHIVKDQEYNNMCNTYGGQYAEDLYQEFCCTIMQYTNVNKLYEIFQRGQLLWFCCTIIKTMATTTTSPFYKKIRKFSTLSSELPVTYNETSDEYQEPLEMCNILDSLNEPLNQIDEWFNSKIKEAHKYDYKYTMFKLHFYDNLSYREIEKRILNTTGGRITHVSIFHSLKEVIKEMSNELNLDKLTYH